MIEPSNLRDAAPVEPVAWKNYAPDGDWWLTDEREPADSCDYSVPLYYAHPPAAPTDALVEKAREWAIVVREADKQWSQPLSTLLEQLAAALAAAEAATIAEVAEWLSETAQIFKQMIKESKPGKDTSEYYYHQQSCTLAAKNLKNGTWRK